MACKTAFLEIRMFIKKSITLAILVAAFSLIVLGQSGTSVEGTVELERSGNRTPLAGAKVDIFPTDTMGQGKSVTTGEDGKFSFTDLTPGKIYIISVSASGASPTFLEYVRPGMTSVLITTTIGDGKSVTEADLKKAIETAESQLSEADKKKRAEELAKRREIEDKNRKVIESTKAVETALKAGIAAFEKKDFLTAAARFEEGYQASPDFEGSAPVLLKNKAVSLRQYARKVIVDAQQGDSAAKTAAREKAQPSYTDAVNALVRSLEVIAAAPANSEVKNLAEQKKDTYINLIETLGDMYETYLTVPEQVDASKIVAGYTEAETNAKLKLPLLKSFGTKAMQGGAVEASAFSFKKILESEPKDLDALSGAAVALGAMAFIETPPNAALLQEASKYGKLYLDSAPKDHKNQAAVADIMENIKGQPSSKE